MHFFNQTLNKICFCVFLSDVKKLLQLRPLKYRNAQMSVQIYVPPILNTIVITGDLVNEDNLDRLEMYFDSEKKSSGGGVVEESTTFDKETSAIYITFEEAEGNHIQIFYF